MSQEQENEPMDTGNTSTDDEQHRLIMLLENALSVAKQMSPVCKGCKEGSDPRSQLKEHQETNESLTRSEGDLEKTSKENEELSEGDLEKTRKENEELSEGDLEKTSKENEELRSQLKKWQDAYDNFRKSEGDLEKTRKENEELRSQLKKCQDAYDNFRKRMGNQASADIGIHGEACRDINNPCRKDELKKSYEKLKRNVWPKYLEDIKKIQGEKGEMDLCKAETDQTERIIKEVFDKAADEMKETRRRFECLFKINDSNETDKSKKRLFYMEMAIQKLQMMILFEDHTFSTDVKVITQGLPDQLYGLACKCYKQGCLMALHNPPLTLAWNQKKNRNPFPPIAEETQL